MQYRLNNLGRDKRLILAAEKIIDLDSCAVSKPVRAGFTTSAVIACEQKDLRCVVIAPTKKIIMETVPKAAADSIRIPSNSECLVIEDMIRKTPLLAQLPIPLQDCEQCTKRYDDHGIDRCPVNAILNGSDFKIVTLTYQKLQALMLSKGKTAQEIMERLAGADVVLLDEAHELVTPKTASVPVDIVPAIPTGKYDQLDTVVRSWDWFRNTNRTIVDDLLERAEEGHASQHLSTMVCNKNIMDWRDIKIMWKQLAEAAIEGTIDDENILVIRDIIHILSSPWIDLGYISDAEGASGKIMVSAQQTRLLNAINEFLTKVVPTAKHIYGSATLFEPRPGFFNALSGKEIKQVTFPDIRDTAKKMTLIADRWKLTSLNFDEKLPEIVETIKEIVQKEKRPVYILAPNARKSAVIRGKLGVLPNVYVDYYRSDRTIGVERSERVCISVGMAEIPANACDPLARGATSEERWVDSRMIRRQNVHAATWQAVNRVRDPRGEEESHVYFIGCRLAEVKMVASWGTERRLKLIEIKEHKSNNIVKFPIFSVEVTDAITIPKIVAEESIEDHSERRSAADFIKNITNSLKSGQLLPQYLYNINRGNGAKLAEYLDCSFSLVEEGIRNPTIYNFPIDENQMASTCVALYAFFCHRVDTFATQLYNEKNKMWGYRKRSWDLSLDDMYAHISGRYTFGTYQIDIDDTVEWICFDVDNHDGKSNAMSDAKVLVQILRQYNIPFLLEASGSPDSYHIWIFLTKTKTINAFKFSRQILNEAGIKCEVFPKQKKIEGKGKSGNLVKIPVCINKKSGFRSVFLDPDTFKPLSGPISLPGVVSLYELPEASNVIMPRARPADIDKSQCRRAWSGESLNYCMLGALHDKVRMTGGEGHEFRVAIAVRAQAIAMSPEETAKLFEIQNDYSYEFSLTKVKETWNYGYAPYSCKTLQDKCGSIVKPYCQTCPCRADIAASTSRQSA